MTWQEELEHLFKTPAGAARALHTQWKDAAPAEATAEVEALANNIRKLIKGRDLGWWSHRPVLRGLLAKALGFDPNEIFGGKEWADDDLPFPEFPRLPPLSMGEQPCQLGPRGSLLDVVLLALRPSPRSRVNAWIKAPAGAGKSLVIHYLQSRHAGDIAAYGVARLEDLDEPSVDIPLVVAVEEPASAEGIDRLLDLGWSSSPIVILSSFPIPPALEPHGSEEQALWLEHDGAPGLGWRKRMLHWIDRRLAFVPGDTKLEPDVVAKWLDEHDPQHRTIATPGDLLALCADFDTHGRTGRPIQRARRWLSATGRSMLPSDAPETWRKRNAARHYQSLVIAEVHHGRKRYGSLDAADWQGLLEKPSSDRVARTPSPVDFMLEAGLLRPDKGGIIAYPRWVARAFAVDALTAEVTRSEPSGWGALAADDSRRALIDDVFDVLPVDALRRLTSTVADRGSPNSLGDLAELESTLAAVARRINRGNLELGRNDKRIVQDLLVHQTDALVELHYGPEVPHPYTRRDLDEWYATAWTLSLEVPAPEGFDCNQSPWQFPGWVDVLELSKVPRRFPWTSVQPFEASLGAQRIIVLASRIVPKIERGPLDDKFPRLLLPAMFLHESFLDWLKPRHLFQLRGTWEGSYLAERLPHCAAEVRHRLAERAWQMVGADLQAHDSVSERINRLQRALPELAASILSAISPTTIAETARTHGIHQEHVQDPRELLRLSPDQRRAALLGWKDRVSPENPAWSEAREMGALFGTEDIDLLVQLVQGSPGSLACELATPVWRMSPERAVAETRIALERELAASVGWFYAAPREHFGTLIDLLEQMGRRPDWFERWAHRHVLDSGEAAERIHRMVKGTTAAAESR